MSGGLERFLRARGERVVRVPPKVMAVSRKSARTYGKSDSIDALAVARAALADPDLPPAHDDAAASELKLLSDHRANLIRERSTAQDRLRWHLHDLWPELQIPPGALDRAKWLERVSRRLGRRAGGARVWIMRQLVRQIRRLTREANELEREIARLVVTYALQLLSLPGCGALIAGRIIGEIGGIERFRKDAQLARLAGVAPLDASSGRQRRHRLNRHGNPQFELGAAQDRRRPRPGRSPRSGVPGAQATRGQDTARSASGAQAPPRPPDIRPAPAADLRRRHPGRGQGARRQSPPPCGRLGAVEREP